MYNNDIAANYQIATGYGIKQYNSSSNQFTCPYDGYIQINDWGGNRIEAVLVADNVSASLSFNVTNGTREVFVKKGQKVYFNYTSTSSMMCMYFYLGKGIKETLSN